MADAAAVLLGAKVRALTWPAWPDISFWPSTRQRCQRRRCEGKRTAAEYLHFDEILIVLVVFGEVGLNELLRACEGFVPTATKQCYPEEAQASGNQ